MVAPEGTARPSTSTLNWSPRTICRCRQADAGQHWRSGADHLRQTRRKEVIQARAIPRGAATCRPFLSARLFERRPFRFLARSSRIPSAAMVMPSSAEPKLPSFSEARQAVEEYASDALPTRSPRCCRCWTPSDWCWRKIFAPTAISRLFRAPLAMALRCVPPMSPCACAPASASAKSGREQPSSRAPSKSAQGEAAEIMTGRSGPVGADAVVMVEHTDAKRRLRHRSSVRCRRARMSLPLASEAQQGSVMVARGTRINHTTVAVAAAMGARRSPCTAVRESPSLRLAMKSLTSILPPGPTKSATRTATRWRPRFTPRAASPRFCRSRRDQADELALLLRKGLGGRPAADHRRRLDGQVRPGRTGARLL